MTWKPPADNSDWQQHFGKPGGAEIDFMTAKDLSVIASFTIDGKKFQMEIAGYFRHLIDELRKAKEEIRESSSYYEALGPNAIRTEGVEINHDPLPYWSTCSGAGEDGAETEEWPGEGCPVTPEMVSAGVSALEFGQGSYGDQQLVSSVYRAMWEVRPLAPASRPTLKETDE